MTVPGWAFIWGVGVATLVAPWVGREGISMYGRCCRGHCGDGSEAISSLLLGLLVMLMLGLEQFAVGRKGLVGELGLVLEPGPVPGLMVSNSMLQDHDFEHSWVWR